MSNRTKEEQRRASLPPGMLPKSERRQLGKQAALQRARARRNRKIFNNLALVAVGLVVVGLIAWVLGAFGSDGTPNASTASPGVTASAGAQPETTTNPVVIPDALKDKPTVTKGTGDVTKLDVKTLIQGTGAAVQAGQTITVNYVGVLYKDGEEFDTSFGREPFSTVIGQGSVIPGWDQGLVGVKVGSRVQLDIPADLAYGETSSDGSPAGDLRFVVDVLAAQ